MSEDITITVQPHKADELILHAHNSLVVASEFHIDSGVMLEIAVDELKNTKNYWKTLDEKRKELKAPLDEAAKRIQAFFKPALDACESAEKVYKTEIARYQTEQARIRADEQRKADAAAQAERERLRQEAEKCAQEAAKATGEEAQQLAQAAQEKVMQAEMTIAPVMAQQKAPAGVSTRKTWSAEVTDLKAFLQAILDGKIPETMVSVNTKELGKIARALGANLNYPGVTVTEESTLAVRS